MNKPLVVSLVSVAACVGFYFRCCWTTLGINVADFPFQLFCWFSSGLLSSHSNITNCSTVKSQTAVFWQNWTVLS